jgi:hypothetical protein
VIGRPVTMGHPAAANWRSCDAPPASLVRQGTRLLVWQGDPIRGSLYREVVAKDGLWQDEMGRTPWGHGSPGAYWCELIEPVIPLGEE